MSDWTKEMTIEAFMKACHEDGGDVTVSLELDGVWHIMVTDREISQVKFGSGGSFAHAVRSYRRAKWQLRFLDVVDAGKAAILEQMRKRRAIEGADA